MTQPLSANPEQSVIDRYSEGAKAREAALCCPVSFDPQYLKVLPEEVLERDYGCGDPTPYVRAGDTVLDLGSGGGKVCWIAAQIVGAEGKVIGVDMNTDMLALARKHHGTIAERVGFDNVVYHRGMIQDLGLDLDRVEQELKERPIDSTDRWLALRELEDRLRKEQPMIADASVDVVLSNCVLNLVRPEDKAQMFAEIFRVVKPGGRVAISDIVCDEDVPVEMQEDPELWSGCISGAYREDLFLEAFAEAGFHGIEIKVRDDKPWQTVNGIEFRAMTVQAFKAEDAPALDRKQAVVYQGPFRWIEDDLGNSYPRGERVAVSDRTFRMLQQPPYAGHFVAVEPREEVPADQAEPFPEGDPMLRDPRETKGADYRDTVAQSDDEGDCCGPAPTSCC